MARWLQAPAGSDAGPTVCTSREPPLFTVALGREAPLVSYRAYDSPPCRSLSTTVCHVLEVVVGRTHASSETAFASASAGESGTATRSSTPSKLSALPDRPSAQAAPPTTVPLTPAPPATLVPDPSSNVKWATGPLVSGGGGASSSAITSVAVAGLPRTAPAPDGAERVRRTDSSASSAVSSKIRTAKVLLVSPAA